MMSATWVDGLRVLFVIGMAYGAWQGYKNRPPTVRYQGKKYFLLPDGRFSNLWGRVVKDQTTIDALKNEAARQPGRKQETA